MGVFFMSEVPLYSAEEHAVEMISRSAFLMPFFKEVEFQVPSSLCSQGALSFLRPSSRPLPPLRLLPRRTWYLLLFFITLKPRVE